MENLLKSDDNVKNNLKGGIPMLKKVLSILIFLHLGFSQIIDPHLHQPQI